MVQERDGESPKDYPGAQLTPKQTSIIERNVVTGVYKRIEDAYSDSDSKEHTDSNQFAGLHTRGCWKLQKRQLWKAYTYACIQSMKRTGQRAEPLKVDIQDVQVADKTRWCGCYSDNIKYTISVSAGNVCWMQ